MTTTDITPFRIDIPKADLEDLQDRLARTRWTDPVEGSGWSYGTNHDRLTKLVDYWRSGFDWRAQEAALNAFPQFMTTIDGQQVHCMHVRSSSPGARPLLLIHGWSGSIAEYSPLIDALTDPAAHGGAEEDAFHVVVPSLPGYGFSGPTSGTGWGSNRAAKVLAKLMSLLGYDRYGVVGNDMGAFVAREFPFVAPEHVVGLHVQQLWAFPSGDPSEFERMSEEETAMIEELSAPVDETGGYRAIQSTRPQTLAYALNDSPAGLLAWNLDILTQMGEHDVLTDDQILVNVAIYWFTQTEGSSMRYYKEDIHGQVSDGVSDVPTAVAIFAKDFHSMRTFAERDNTDIRQWNEYDQGGHFASMEVPDVLVADIREFFRTLR